MHNSMNFQFLPYHTKIAAIRNEHSVMAKTTSMRFDVSQDGFVHWPPDLWQVNRDVFYCDPLNNDNCWMNLGFSVLRCFQIPIFLIYFAFCAGAQMFTQKEHNRSVAPSTETPAQIQIRSSFAFYILYIISYHFLSFHILLSSELGHTNMACSSPNHRIVPVPSAGRWVDDGVGQEAWMLLHSALKSLKQKQTIFIEVYWDIWKHLLTIHILFILDSHSPHPYFWISDFQPLEEPHGIFRTATPFAPKSEWSRLNGGVSRNWSFKWPWNIPQGTW